MTVEAADDIAIARQASVNADAPTSAVTILLLRIAFVIALFLSWEYLSIWLRVQYYVSQPTKIFAQLYEWILDGTALMHLSYTLQETVLGFTFGSIAGISIGLLLGLVPFLSRLLDPIIVAFYSIPKVALAPLFIVWFGIGMTMKVVLSAMSVFFLTLFNTLAGVRDVDRELVDVIRLMKGGQLRIIGEVVLPSVLVWVFSGLRISVPYALIGAVTGEILTSNRGLGFLVAKSANQLDTAGIFAALFELIFVSVTLYTIIVNVERKVLRWKTAGAKS